jgi:nucleoside-diphosphate-sugar epimerase
MKKVLIIGYGDIGSRIAKKLPEQLFIGVSRSVPSDLPNVEFIQQDWIKESKLILPSNNFSTIVLILKPTSPGIDGYQQGFLDPSYQMMDLFNNDISYEKLMIVSSTRVYGLDNGRNITEAEKPMPDDDQARIILEYEEFVSREANVEPLILRPSGLYDEQNHWMRNHVNSFKEKKYPLSFAEANMFNRDNLSLVMANYICMQGSTHVSGPLICSEQAKKYSEIFSIVCPEHSFEDFFISSDNIGKSFDPQKLLESGLMR